MSFKPRDYQSAAHVATMQGFDAFNAQLVVMPTGSGKTVLFSMCADSIASDQGRTLVLVHREELARQAAKKIHATTGMNCGIEMSGERAWLADEVVVAGIQTMGNRLEVWPENHFKLIVCDEAHHSVSASWRKSIDHFMRGGAKLLGVTATPDRGDKKTLGSLYESIAYEVGLFELIERGWLAPITVVSNPIKIDMTGVKTTTGDFDAMQTAHTLEPMIETLAKDIAETCAFRKTIVFLPLIETSKKFAAALRRHGMNAAHVSGESEDRATILGDFSRDKYNVLCNAMLLTEGYDEPGVDCVVVLRPTRSRPLYAQMVGRGTRIHPGKRDLMLLDYLWLHEDHHIARPADLAAGTVEESNVVTALMAGRGGGDLATVMSETVTAREDAIRERLRRMSKRRGKLLSAEEYAFMHGDMKLAQYEPVMPWESSPPTETQAATLAKCKIDPATVLGRGHASALLKRHFDDKNNKPASDKQKWAMRSAGFPNWQNATAQDARSFYAKRRTFQNA